jgi:Uma2 family endonuclease
MSTATVFSALDPPLENGDRLSQPEFHRRYELHPELHHVELIEGTVYMPSPIRFTHHTEPQQMITTWLGTYAAHRTGVRSGGPATVILDGDNEPEPDAILFFDPGAGGQVSFSPRGYIIGAPELVVEISASSASIDLGAKLHAYQRNGVREYIVWSTQEERIRWFALRDGRFEPLVPGERGIIHSTVFDGLRLDVERLLAGDLAAVLAVQSEGD